MNAEKRDVDINKLFYWNDKFNIIDSKGNVKLSYYARIIGDAELNRSRVFALRSSAELRKSLKEFGSEVRMAYLPDFSDLDIEKIIDLLTIFYMKDFTRDALKEVSIKFPKEPHSDATLESQEKYQEEVDNFEENKNKKYKEYVNKRIEALKKELLTKSKEDLIKLYEEFSINELCETKMLSSFQEMNAFFGTYKDKNLKERLFETFEQFDNLPTDIKQQFIGNYSTLELSMDELKK